MKLVAAFLILFSFSQYTFAQDEVTVVDEPTPNLVFRNSSEHNRMDKKYSTLFQPLGIGSSGVGEMALILGKHLDRNDIIQVEISEGGTGKGWRHSHATLRTKVFGLHHKHFFGNSFYTKAGLDYRQAKYDYYYDANENYSFEGDGIVASFAIGNQWQWQNFTLGCDWVGLSASLTRNIKNERISSTPYSWVEERLKEDEDFYFMRNTPQALRFYAGYSF
ncbi:hypothetical protein [Bdellovibrio bacteriovorus]|uniref:hypothetical protein n=1 Tax=Bdellovibrio TaxID=958 RepID=UPI0035A94A18